jgi:hypothetical protein
MEEVGIDNAAYNGISIPRLAGYDGMDGSNTQGEIFDVCFNRFVSLINLGRRGRGKGDLTSLPITTRNRVPALVRPANESTAYLFDNVKKDLILIPQL